MSEIYVSILSPSITASISSAAVSVSLPGTQGVPGPPGADGAAPEITATAAENLSSGRAVIMTAGLFSYFQPSDPLSLGRVVGITKTSATSGQSVDVQTGGVVTDAAFSFDADTPIFVTTDGELTSTPPATGIVHLVGVALAGNKILLNINFSIIQN